MLKMLEMKISMMSDLLLVASFRVSTVITSPGVGSEGGGGGGGGGEG